MVSKTLTFFQIYYREDQIEELYPFATPYFNKNLTSYFESSCILDLVPSCGSDLISVCSWRLRRKRGDSSTEGILKRAGTFELTEERILNTEYDIAVLTPRSPSHRPLAMAANWHNVKGGEYTGAWTNAFTVLKKFLASDIGIKVPDELSNTIYENHFIAKREIYHNYVSQCLEPVLQFVEREGGVFEADSGYIDKKRNDPEAVKDYQRVSGRRDWPIAPFLLERLFSIWIEGKQFKIVNL